jgi:hypothetical protein
MASAQLFLNGARVDADFRAALFDAANRAGITPNEFCIVAAAKELTRRGASFSGIFRRGDLEASGLLREAA